MLIEDIDEWESKRARFTVIDGGGVTITNGGA
jgi:hypothetical protein